MARLEATYEFGDVRVDAASEVVSRSGASVLLEPKAFELLVHFLRHRGRLLDKQEILDAVWGETFVSENALTRVVAQLRKALGDEAQESKYIETVPRRGYRFIAPVRVQGPRALSRQTVAVLVAAVAVVGAVAMMTNLRDRAPERIDSIVALPSDVIGSDAEFLPDAIPKTISTYLAQIEGLETKLPPARIDVEQFEGDLDRIAATFEVHALVLSTLTAQDARLLLNVQLVQAEDRHLLWSGEYEGTEAEYLKLVREAAEELRQEIRPWVPAIDTSAQVAGSSRAELAFQRGLYYSNKFNHGHYDEDFERSFAALQETLDLDPSFSDAAAEIAFLYLFTMEAGLDPQEAVPQVVAWARNALSVNPENGRAWTALTIMETGKGGEGPRFLGSALNAVRFAPRFPIAHVVLMAGLQSTRLRLAAARESARLDPLYQNARALTALEFAEMGSVDEALAENDRALAIEPESSISLWAKCGFLQQAGRLAEAEALLRRIEPMVAEGRFHPGWFRSCRAVNVLLQSKPGEAEAELERLRQLASGTDRFPYWHIRAKGIVDTLGIHQRFDEARELLLLLDEAGVLLAYDRIMLVPENHWIRDDPQLAPIVSKSRKQFEEIREILEEARTRGELPAYLEQPLSELVAELGMR